MARTQIGMGGFAIRQNGRTDDSAWVFSDGATSDETWIWINALRPVPPAPSGADPHRVLKTVINPTNQVWKFVPIAVNSVADLIAFALASDTLDQYVLVGYTHGKVVLGGLSP